MLKEHIYMDHSATTPLREEVLEMMLPYMREFYGNASSLHGIGQEAEAGLEDARKKVAGLLGASPDEIVFTGGGTESNNLAIKGIPAARKDRGKHIVASSVEHKSVLASLKHLEKNGHEVTLLPVDKNGVVEPSSLESVLREDTVLVSVMLANNETGVLQPVREMSDIIWDNGAIFHTDAVQAVGKIPLNVDDLGIDLLSLSAHKFYGPKGVGVLYRRSGVKIEPNFHGGHQENGLRAGTENIPAIIGLAGALELSVEDMDEEKKRLAAMRDQLERGIRERIDNVRINGKGAPRLPHLLNVSIEGVEGESLLMILDSRGISISTGSACTSDTLDPSHVLSAMGIAPEMAHGSLRFSLGRANGSEDIDYVLNSLCEAVRSLRNMSPTYHG